MVRIKVNGRNVKVKSGTTVLEACRKHDIYIPTLCYQPGLTPYGGCRLCLVEVKGWSKPTTACTLPVQNGMEIATESPQLKRLRRFSLELILSEHPHACLICDRTDDCAKYQECIQKAPVTFGCKFCSQNGTCELQKLVDYLDVKKIPFEFSYRNLGVERHDPFFDRDYNLCVLCGRCVRACQELRGAGVLDFHHRGPRTLVGTAYDMSHLETGCQFCGACVDACPTGALRDRYGKWLGAPDKTVKTTCLLCNLGCSVNVNVRGNSVVNTTPDNNPICVRGRFGIAPLVAHKERITVPMLKRNGRRVQVTWQEALEFASSRLSAEKGRTGILFSSQLTGEALDGLGRLARHLACTSFATTAPMSGTDQTFDVNTVKKDAVFIIINTDMTADFSPLLIALRKRFKNSTFLVIDPVASRFAENANLWLKPVPGKEMAVLDMIGTGRYVRAAGVAKEDIARAIELVKAGSPYVLYDRANLPEIKLPKRMTSLPLASRVNTLKIQDMGITATPADVLNGRNVDCLYLVGAAPRFTKRYGTIIVQDCFLPDFDFDLFLPAAHFIETGGSVVLFNGKKKRLRKAIEPAGKSRSDEWIISEIGKMTGVRGKGGALKQPKKGAAASKRLPAVDSRFPLMLISRENCYVFRNAPLSRLLTGFRRLRPDRAAWIAPDTAQRYNLTDNAAVLVNGRSVRLEVNIHISDTVPENAVLVYFLDRSNSILSQPVRIEPASPRTTRIKKKPGTAESGSE